MQIPNLHQYLISRCFATYRYIAKPALVASLVLALSAGMSAQAQVKPTQINSSYQTYVIHTYGGADLIPAVTQILSGSGSSVSAYQDKLVVRTTAEGYQAVQQLLNQIDQAPIPLTISIKVGAQSNSEGSIRQGRIIINQHGIIASGNVANQNNSELSNSLYQVNTLSGKSATITTGTIFSLAQRYLGSIYDHKGNPIAHIRVNGQTLTNISKGVTLQPRILPNNQVELYISQVEDRLRDSSDDPSPFSTYRHNHHNHLNRGNNSTIIPSYNSDTTVQTHQLATTVTVTRGQWVSIGEISQIQQKYSSGNYVSNTSTTEVNYPIMVKIE